MIRGEYVVIFEDLMDNETLLLKDKSISNIFVTGNPKPPPQNDK